MISFALWLLSIDVLFVELLGQVAEGLTVLAHLQLIDHLQDVIFLLLLAAFLRIILSR